MKVLRRIKADYAEAAEKRSAGVIADARAEGFGAAEAACHLPAIASIDVRRATLAHDGEVGNDDYDW